MSRAQRSSTNELKRKLAVGGVIFVGWAAILHFTLPWFKLGELVGGFFDLAGKYPKIAVLPFAIVGLLFAAAYVDDIFTK